MARAVRRRKSKRDAVVVVVRPRAVGRSRALVSAGGKVFPAALGRSGRTIVKREGDGATPRGRLQLEYGFFRGDRIALPSSRLRLVRIASDMGWCDSPSHPCYNRPVRLPFAASHERLMREDGLYDVCLVMEWNRRHRRRNAGSAIFFHVARPDFAPTEGCVAVSLPAMRQLLALAGPKTHVVVA